MASEVIGDSPYAVAYRLLEVVAAQEGHPLGDPTMGAYRRYVLDVYKECLKAVLEEDKRTLSSRP